MSPLAHGGRTDWVATRGLPLALALSGILWIGPYWAWTTPAYFRASVVLVLLAFVLTLGVVRTTFPIRNLLLVVSLLALLLYYGAHQYGGPFVLSSGWLVVVIFVLADDDVKRAALRYFTIAFAISLVPGIVVFLLSAAGVDVPWHAIAAKRFDFDVLLGNTPGFYRGYPGSVVLNDQVIAVGGRTVFRLQAMYDEPGVVGTFCALLLAAGEMRVRRNPYNALLLLGGLLSFSMAFYGILLVYSLLRKPLATVALAAAAGLLLMSTALANSAIVQLYFLSRFGGAGGRMFGDNRVTGLFTALYADFWRADLWTRLFGSPHDVTVLVNTGNFSYKVLIYAYGLVGGAALVAFLVAATTSLSRGRAALTLLAVFVLSIYQRPDVLSLPYLLVLLGGAAHLRYRAEAAAPLSMPAPRSAAIPS